MCPRCRLEFQDRSSVTGDARGGELWFGFIADAAVDSTGRLYVADPFRHELLRVDLGTGGVLAIGRDGEGPGEFRRPVQVVVAADGAVFVYDLQLHRVSEFDTASVFARSFQAPAEMRRFESIVTDNRGQLYVTAQLATARAGPLIHKLSATGARISSFLELPESGAYHHYGGELWWDSATETLWYSRRGPVFELLQLDTLGTVLRHLMLEDGTLDDPGGYTRSTTSTGQLVVRPPPVRGTVQLLALPGRYLANVSVLESEPLRLRYDVFRLEDGAFLARWIDEGPAPILWSGGGNHVLGLAGDPPDLTRCRAVLRGEQER